MRITASPAAALASSGTSRACSSTIWLLGRRRSLAPQPAVLIRLRFWQPHHLRRTSRHKTHCARPHVVPRFPRPFGASPPGACRQRFGHPFIVLSAIWPLSFRSIGRRTLDPPTSVNVPLKACQGDGQEAPADIAGQAADEHENIAASLGAVVWSGRRWQPRGRRSGGLARGRCAAGSCHRLDGKHMHLPRLDSKISLEGGSVSCTFSRPIRKRRRH